MFPESFVQRIRSQDYIDAELLFKSLEQPSCPSIRINTSKWTKLPLNSESVPWCNSGFYLTERPAYTPDPLFHAGCYYPQEASGMFIEQVFTEIIGKKKKIRVLDLCGAPGGKSTHLSSLIGDGGFLVSNEVIRTRSLVLCENLTRWGLSNTIVTQNDPSFFAKLPGFFDLILVDAPCSGEGMFRNPAAVREWSLENALLCSRRQKRILTDVLPALKEGGFLVYSTCTFNADENEKNIEWIVKNKECMSVRIDVSGYKGITEIEYKGICGYGFYPGKLEGEGLFLAVVRKTGEIEKINYRPKTEKKLKIDIDETKIAAEWTSFPEESLIKLGNDLISIPCSHDDYLLLSEYLRIVNTGTKICRSKGRNLIPSHDIAMSVFFRKGSFPCTYIDQVEALSFLSRGKTVLNRAVKGWSVLNYKGIPLGFINNIGSRINNYYPVSWRIRRDVTGQINADIIKWDQDILL